MAGRFYEQPKQPTDWKKTDERTFYAQLMDVLDDLHLPIKEAWLDEKLKRKITDGGTGGKNYSIDVQDTGVKWVDGSAIKRVTQTFNVPANNDTDSNPIDSFGTIINVEGYVVTSSNAVYMVGKDVNVWKAGSGNTFKVNSAYSGEANITVYFIEAQTPPTPVGTYVLFDNGYVDGIGWSANLLTRPNYTTYTTVILESVETDGIMVIGITGGSTSLLYNCHVCTTDKVAIPADATKMYVKARRISGTNAIMKFGLLGDGYEHSCSSEGGIISAAQYVGATEGDYSIDLPAGFAGSSDYRAVVNIQDAGGTARNINISKVWFE